MYSSTTFCNSIPVHSPLLHQMMRGLKGGFGGGGTKDKGGISFSTLYSVMVL